MHVVEPHYERSKHHNLHESKEEVTESTAEEIDFRSRKVRERRLDDKNEARAEYLAQEKAKCSEESEEGDPWLE